MNMTREDLDFIGSMAMRDEISDEAYKKIVCHFEGQEQKMEWIPVSEALPPNDDNVLAVYQNGRMEVVYYHIDSAFYPIEYADENETGWYDWDDEALDDEPIAWMQLPKAYGEG